jgi:hypothetical protein
MPFGDPFTKSGCIVQVLIHGKGLDSTVCWALPQTFQKAKGLAIAFLKSKRLLCRLCQINYIHSAMLTWKKCEWASDFHTEVRNYCWTHKLCDGHSIDLLGHIVFQSKLGMEPTNGKQQVESTPQGHILFQSKLGDRTNNWQVTNVVVDPTRSYIISK